MRKRSQLSLALLLTLSATVHAEESKIILGLEVGSSRLDLGADIIDDINPDELDSGGVSATYSMAYRWANNIVIDGSLTTSGNAFFNLGLSDFYLTSEAKVLVGYNIEIAEHFRIVPLVGISRWDTELQESFFLNPGPEAQGEFDGTDFSYKISAEFPLNNGFILTLSHANTNSDIGDLRLTQAGIKFEF